LSVHPVPVTLEPHVIAAIREVVRDALDDYLPARAKGTSPPAASTHPDVTQPEPPARVADIRGTRVHTDGSPVVTFTRRRGQCPKCNQRLPLNTKIVGFERVDSPDLLVWVCWRCADRLRT
jgi:hypothetical protein